MNKTTFDTGLHEAGARRQLWLISGFTLVSIVITGLAIGYAVDDRAAWVWIIVGYFLGVLPGLIIAYHQWRSVKQSKTVQDGSHAPSST